MPCRITIWSLAQPTQKVTESKVTVVISCALHDGSPPSPVAVDASYNQEELKQPRVTVVSSCALHERSPGHLELLRELRRLRRVDLWSRTTRRVRRSIPPPAVARRTRARVSCGREAAGADDKPVRARRDEITRTTRASRAMRWEEGGGCGVLGREAPNLRLEVCFLIQVERYYILVIEPTVVLVIAPTGPPTNGREGCDSARACPSPDRSNPSFPRRTR